MGLHIAIAIIFFVIGGILGVVITDVCVAAGNSDEQKRYERKKKDPDSGGYGGSEFG